MRFEAKLLPADALASRKVKLAPKDEWYAHLTGLLLDRIQVEVTDRVVASRDGRVAGHRLADGRVLRPRPRRERPAEPLDERLPGGKGQVPGSYAHRYAGGGGYAKISRLEAYPGALLVEVHAAFLEPKEWFQGAPILRSKIALVAQDRIRKLRRDLAKRPRQARRRRPRRRPPPRPPARPRRRRPARGGAGEAAPLTRRAGSPRPAGAGRAAGSFETGFPPRCSIRSRSPRASLPPSGPERAAASHEAGRAPIDPQRIDNLSHRHLDPPEGGPPCCAIA